MRIKRIQDDFRVFEVLDEGLLGPGPCTLYRVTKRGLTTFEAVDALAREAKVEREAIAFAGLKDKDGVTGQFMTVRGGRPVDLHDHRLTLRRVGSATRPLTSADNQGNSFELVLRDLDGPEMARLRHNILEVRECGLPAYFDDQRFGCLRHGQGFIVRKLLRGDLEGALRDLMCAPSPFGSEEIERFKAGMARRWGDWKELASYCRGRRGATLFEHLSHAPEDFQGAMERGIATRERTIHLFAYQSHLWNRAAALWIRQEAAPEDLAWLPGDDGALPVSRRLSAAKLARLKDVSLPLYGAGVELDERSQRCYEAVFRAEGVKAEDFLALDIGGFRPQSEPRPLLMFPQYLRAAPAERDDLYRHNQKMRLRFTLPRGHYATLVVKRLALPRPQERLSPTWHPRMWVSRHCLEFPDSEGRMRVVEPQRRDRRLAVPQGGRPVRRGGKPARRDGKPARRDGKPARRDGKPAPRPARRGKKNDEPVWKGGKWKGTSPWQRRDREG